MEEEGGLRLNIREERKGAGGGAAR
eukprot:COSAG01_NODE_36077_length_522_cov_2.028369_1_plen_24_part_01